MKRYLSMVATIVLMAIPVSSYPQKNSDQPIKTDRDRYNFFGPVEMIRFEWATFSDKPDEYGEYVELERVGITTLVFDIDGKLVFGSLLPSGACTGLSQRVPVYNDKGNVIEKITYDFQASFMSKATFEYDENGNRTEEAHYGPSGLGWSRKYDAKGRTIEEARYSDKGSLEYREVTTFDENENSIERRTYDRDGVLTKRSLVTSEYDEKGNRIKDVLWECSAEDEWQPCKPYEAFYSVITYHSGTKEKQP